PNAISERRAFLVGRFCLVSSGAPSAVAAIFDPSKSPIYFCDSTDVHRRCRLNSPLTAAITKQNATMASRIPTVIQIGASTHHHDQLITPHNLSVMKTMVSRPVNPIPPLPALDSFDTSCSLSTLLI